MLGPILGALRGMSALAGAEGGAVAGIGKAVNTFASATFNTQLVTQGLSSLGKALAGLPAAPIHAFTSALNLMQAPVLAVVGALKGFRDAVGAVGSAVSEFVRLSNPIYVLKFNLALDDLTASIGRTLTPVLETATVFVRMFADVLFKLSGPIASHLQSVLKPLSEHFQNLTNALLPAAASLGTIIKLATAVVQPFMRIGESLSKLALLPVEIFATNLASALESLVVPMMVANRVVGDLANAFGKWVDHAVGDVRRLLGMPGGFGSSVGAAVRPAQIGSVEDYGRKAQQAAFSLGTAAGPADRTADATEKLYTWFTTGGFRDLLIQVVNGLIPKLPGEETSRDVTDRIAEAAAEAGRRLDNLRDRGARALRGLGLDL